MFAQKQGARSNSCANSGGKWAQLVLRAPLALLVSIGLLTSCKPAPEPKITVKLPESKTLKITSPSEAYPLQFHAWLAANPSEVPRFEALKAYLAREGVADVLPAWQVVQTETVEAAAKCGIDGFAVPPESMWPQIVPTLRLVRAEIIPLVGPVKVLSSFRTNEANKCSLGAPESPHKRYSALDLAILGGMPQKEMFAKLCKHWYGLSPSWGYGLGAYYVRNYPAYNQEGRFHVDTLGRRTWGYSYGAYTSHCRELGYIKVKSPEQIKAEEEAKLKAEEEAKLKVEADAKAKLDLETKAKADLALKTKQDAEAKAKAAKETARLKAKEEADTLNKLAVPVVVPKAEPLTQLN